jgi:two-component system sensor histidine kinase DesK
VIRHSGAGECEIEVGRDGEIATLTIVDNGRTIGDDLLRGNGLRGLGERVNALGGTLTAGPDPAGGFRLAALVPAPRVDTELESDLAAV